MKTGKSEYLNKRSGNKIKKTPKGQLHFHKECHSEFLMRLLLR